MTRLNDVLSQHNLHIIGIPDIDTKRTIESLKYIKKCAEHAQSMTLVLPKTYKKDIFKCMFPLSFKMIFEDDFRSDYIRLKGKYRFVPSIIQIWVPK
jgi:TFIIF-interacting CTD phosphatase-like protein